MGLSQAARGVRERMGVGAQPQCTAVFRITTQ